MLKQAFQSFINDYYLETINNETSLKYADENEGNVRIKFQILVKLSII